MELNQQEMMPGLYGSQISKSRAVGYCPYHQVALTTKTLKRHNCLGKQCGALQKYEEHDFWRQHEQKKTIRRAKKQAMSVILR